MADTAAVENILADRTEIVPIDSIKQYHQNPRVGNMKAIRESIRENGIFRPIIVQRSTGEIIGGNHTWKAARQEGYTKVPVVFLDVDDQHAARIVLADNRTNDLSTYNTDVLADILKTLPSGVGTGYDDEAMAELLGSVQEQNVEAIRDIVRPPVIVSAPDDNGEVTAEVGNYIGGSAPQSGQSGPVYTAPAEEQDPEDNDDLADELGELQGLLQLREDVTFPGSNYYNAADLVPGGLLKTLPQPIDTWAGQDATPDDGVTNWVWNYGVASKKGLPMDRAILCFFTYDTYFESFWDQPAFMTAKVLNAGIKTAVVPDYSYYTETGVATWVYNHYRAQWVGRYLQEAGIKVIPRIQYAVDKKDSASLDFNCMGIPVGSPVVAKSSHNANTPEEFELEKYGLEESLKKIKPETLLIYGGNPAKRLIEEMKMVERGLVNEVVHIFNYAHKRRGVVFDKKEGMASAKYRALKAKEKKARDKDKAADDDQKVIMETERSQPKKKSPKPKAADATVEAPTDEETL